MAEEGRNGDGATVALKTDCHFKSDGVDLISLLPDVILQTILSSLPTGLAVKTSILSKRWRHVWSGTPSLYIGGSSFYSPRVDSIDIFLERYTVRKMMSFELCVVSRDDGPYVDRWIEFAMSRNVENMSLYLNYHKIHNDEEYQVPDVFYINNFIKQLSVDLAYGGLTLTVPSYVSWTSLKMLSLRKLKLNDERLDKILSGCPVLESLSLFSCIEPMVLDLSKSLSLRTLEIYSDTWCQHPEQIVAPHIRCLRLRNLVSPCTLVDVSSLNEATLDFGDSTYLDLKADFLQDMVLKMLEKLQNVEKLILEENFLKILSLAEVCGVPFPSFKVKDLTLVTLISQYVIPGIVRVLQNSPELKKLTTVHTRDDRTIPGRVMDEYLQSLNPVKYWSLEARVFESMIHCHINTKPVASFIEVMLKNTKTLEKMIVRLKGYDQRRIFEELLEMVPMLSDKNNVSIMLSSQWNQTD